MKRDSGFAVFELITLLLLLCVFFAGIAVLTRNVGSLKDVSGKDPVSREGEKLLDDLGAVFDQAAVIVDGPDGITVYGDLDGDAGTGRRLSSMEGNSICRLVCIDFGGLEKAGVHQEGKSGKLLVDVYTSEDKPHEAVLTDQLDRGVKNPFIIRYSRLDTGPSECFEVDGITVSVALEKDGDSRDFKRTYRLEKPVYCITK